MHSLRNFFNGYLFSNKTTIIFQFNFNFFALEKLNAPENFGIVNVQKLLLKAVKLQKTLENLTKIKMNNFIKGNYSKEVLEELEKMDRWDFDNSPPLKIG